MRVLVFTEDNAITAQLQQMVSQITTPVFELSWENDLASVIATLQEGAFDLLLVDARIIHKQETDFREQLQSPSSTTPIVLLADSTVEPSVIVDAVLDLDYLNGRMLAQQLHHVVELRRLKTADTAYNVYVNALEETTAAINSTLDLAEILERIFSRIQTAIPHDAANIMLLDGKTANIVYLSGYEQRSPNTVNSLTVQLDENPILSNVLATTQPILITDTHAFNDWHNLSEADWIRTHITVPLCMRNKIVGFLNLDSRTPDAFNHEHVAWLETFAKQIGNALYNTRLQNDESRYRQEISAIQSLIKLVSSTLDLDPLINNLLKHLLAVISYDSVTLLLMEDNYLEVVANRGSKDPAIAIGQRIALRHTALNTLIKTRESIISPDSQNDPRLEDLGALASRHSWLGVPLLAQGIFIGCLILESDQIGRYGKPDAILATTFAHQAAIAIHNAQLYEELRRYANELEERVAERTMELVEANTAIKQNEQRFRTLFEATFEGIVVHDQGTILATNSAFQRQFNYSQAEMLGMSILDLVAPESREIINYHARSGSETPYEATGLRRDSTTFPAEVYGRAIEYEGRPVRIAAVRDLTERKEKEQHKLELAMERERTHILTRFITQASHEFRTPLTIISINAEMMKRLACNEDMNNRSDIIKDQVTYISKLISNMVSLSILDNEQQAIDFRRINLATIINATRQTSVALGKAKQQEVVYEIQDYPLYLWGNGDYLQQAIDQLIENAINHTPAGGKITVMARRKDNQTIIEITDTGTGISNEHLPNIFDRFYRVDKAGTTRGFGLGLSLASIIVARHSGRIEVETEVNQGTTFRILLPLNP